MAEHTITDLIWWMGAFGSIVFGSLAILVLLGPSFVVDAVAGVRALFSLEEGSNG